MEPRPSDEAMEGRGESAGIAGAPGPGGFDWKGVTLIAALPLVLHLWAHRDYGIFRDEFYYLACARRLAWGYVDHPPFSIAILRLWTLVFGDSQFSLRVIPALLASTTVLLAAQIARRLGGGAGAQRLAALAVSLAPLLLGLTSFYSMNAWDLALWSGLFLLVVTILNGGSSRLWLAVGLLAGMALLNKLSVLVWGVALVAGLALTPHRKQFARWELWAGGGLAVLMFLPHVAWQAANDAPTLDFLSNAANLKNTNHSFTDFVLGLVVELHPLNAAIWLTGIGWLLFGPGARPYRMLGWMALIVFVLFFLQGGKVYYVAPLAPMLLAAGGVAVDGLLRRSGKAWAPAMAPRLLLVGGIVTAPLAVPLLPPAALVAYQERLGLRAVQEEQNELAELDQHFADRFGWEEMTEGVLEVVSALPEAERDRALILTRNYGEAGALEYFGRGRGMPHVASGHNNYALWGYGETPTMVVAVGMPKAFLDENFGEAEMAARLDLAWALPDERHAAIFVCREPLKDFEDIWSAARKFI